MSDSETSSDNLHMNFIEEEQKNKIVSSSTDMYHNMLSNPAKEKEIVNETSSITRSDGSASSVQSNSSSESSSSNTRRSSEKSRKSNKSNKSDKSGKSDKSDKSGNSKKKFSPVNIRVDSPAKGNTYKGLDVEPKKGRAVIFPGEYYHNSSTPKNHSKRIVVNYNFT